VNKEIDDTKLCSATCRTLVAKATRNKHKDRYCN